MAGRCAVRCALQGRTDVMVSLLRPEGAPYRCETGLVPLEAIAGKERLMPAEYVDDAGGLPSPAFARYAAPLIGGPLPRFSRL